MFHPTRGGTRGGQGDFKWTDVAADKDREYYLGHSLNAPVGRWQNGKDLNWYQKDKDRDVKEEERLRKEEIRKVKEAEEDALAVALGFEPTVRNPNNIPTGSGSGSKPTTRDSNEVILEKAKHKAEKEARKLERDQKRKERELRKQSERGGGGGGSPQRRRSGKERERSRSRSRSPGDRRRRRDHDEEPVPRPDERSGYPAARDHRGGGDRDGRRRGEDEYRRDDRDRREGSRRRDEDHGRSARDRSRSPYARDHVPRR